MANAEPITTETPVEIPDRRKVWNDLANTQIQSPDDLYQARKPASALNYDFQRKRGFVEGFFKGVPEEEGYESTFGEAFGAGLTEFARSGTRVGVEFLDPERKKARESIEKVRQYDPEFADFIEKGTIGKRPSDAKLAVEGAAAIGEGVLTFLPFFKAGRALIAAKEAATFAKLGKAGEVILKSPTARNFATGGLYGSIYGTLFPLHTDGDFQEALKYGAIGGVVGAPLIGFGGLALRGLSAGAIKTGSFVKTAAELVSENVPRFLRPSKALPETVYKYLFSTGSTLQKYYGDVGENFVKMWRKASHLSTVDLGRLQLSLIENGIIEAPDIAKPFIKDIKYVGNDRELMNYYNQVLRGQSAYADPIVRASAIGADSRLRYLDTLRKYYGTKSQQVGITENLLDLDTYLPKHTPPVLFSPVKRAALKQATTQAERESIYAANDEVVKDMVENSVFNEKTFGTLEESYKAYYDYSDFVLSGGRILPQDNTFFQKMVADGQANTIDEAAGKIVADLKFRKQTLTPLASSLDFQRKVNLPWYDPNPARVLPVYAVDASARLAMAQTFGARDELIKEMIGKIATDPKRGAEALVDAREFERLIRVITGQIERSPKSERVSQILRAIQVPKLSFAQILNIGQNMNYLLATDFGATAHGLQVIFREQSMRKAIESGVLLNNFLREIFEYSGGGTKFSDAILKYSGFTWTEMFNRSVGAVISERWALTNFKGFLKQRGFAELSEEEQKGILKMMFDKKTFEHKVLQDAIGVQRENIQGFQKLFPDEDFNITAGNVGAAKKKLDKLESAITSKIEKLQKTRQLLERELVAESEPLTDQYVTDLTDAIGFLKGAISEQSVSEIKLPGALEKGTQFTDTEIRTALDGAIQMRRQELESVLKRLEEKFMEIRALGTAARDIPQVKFVDPTKENLGQYVAGVNAEIQAADRAIIGLQNELADKSRFLEGIIDSYQIATKRLANEFPEGLAYDKFLEKRRGEFKMKDISAKAKTLTAKNGGVTISLNGDVPENGFAFAPSKITERVITQDRWTLEDVDRFMEDNLDALNTDDAFLGVWVDEGKVYMDVSVVVADKTEALVRAKTADQISVFDLEKFETHFIKDNEKIISDAIRKGQVEGAVEGGTAQLLAGERVARPGREVEAGIRLAKAPSEKVKLSPEEIALRELEVDLDEAKLRGFLSPDDLVTAAQVLVVRTQFSGRAIDLPFLASSPMGKVIFQFKTFAYQQARFLSKEIKRDLARETRNLPRAFRTLLILSTIFPMTGEVLGDIRSLITQEKRPTRPLDRYISDISNAGAYGLLFDFWNSAEIGKTAEFFGGVTVGDATKFIEGVIVRLPGNPKSAGINFSKQLLRQTGVGRIGVNVLFPSKKQGQPFYQDLLDWAGDEE